MLKSELLEIIANGENSGVEFKRDDVRPEQIAKEVVALINLQGGRLLIGVEDDRTITGLQRDDCQEWILNVFRDKIHPQVIPFYEEVTVDDGKRVAVVTLPAGISKPYVVRHNNREDTYVRMGDRSELATREQQARLFESGGLLHVEVLPVAGASMSCLDLDRISYYLREVVADPEVPESVDEWEDRLVGMGLMAEDGHGHNVCSVAGLLCFGVAPRRFLKQAGLRLMVFDSADKEYQAKLDVFLDGPLVGRWKVVNSERQLIDGGLIERLASAIEPFVRKESGDVDASFRRGKPWDYPREALREVIVNALAHRDWTRSVEIEIVAYSDRLEVTSPGRMQNSMTIRKMVAGQRSPRNPLIMEILRDYGYVDARGMGVRTKVIPLMRSHNGTDPVFEATEDYLKTTLRKPQKRSGQQAH